MTRGVLAVSVGGFGGSRGRPTDHTRPRTVVCNDIEISGLVSRGRWRWRFCNTNQGVLEVSRAREDQNTFLLTYLLTLEARDTRINQGWLVSPYIFKFILLRNHRQNLRNLKILSHRSNRNAAAHAAEAWRHAVDQVGSAEQSTEEDRSTMFIDSDHLTVAELEALAARLPGPHAWTHISEAECGSKNVFICQPCFAHFAWGEPIPEGGPANQSTRARTRSCSMAFRSPRSSPATAAPQPSGASPRASSQSAARWSSKLTAPAPCVSTRPTHDHPGEGRKRGSSCLMAAIYSICFPTSRSADPTATAPAMRDRWDGGAHLDRGFTGRGSGRRQRSFWASCSRSSPRLGIVRLTCSRSSSTPVPAQRARPVPPSSST
jgi:hypothetical protein